MLKLILMDLTNIIWYDYITSIIKSNMVEATN